MMFGIWLVLFQQVHCSNIPSLDVVFNIDGFTRDDFNKYENESLLFPCEVLPGYLWI